MVEEVACTDEETTGATVVAEAAAHGEEDVVAEEVEAAAVVVAPERLDMHPTATAAGTYMPCIERPLWGHAKMSRFRQIMEEPKGS